MLAIAVMDSQSVATLRDLLQQAKAAGVLGSLVQEVHDGDEGFELVSQAMTDASKRRMDGPPEGYPEDSRATRVSTQLPVTRFPKAAAKAKSRPVSVLEAYANIGLPPGVPSLEQWGKCLIEFGKYGGQDMAYIDLLRLAEREARAKNYVEWVRTHTNEGSSALLKDLFHYILCYQQENGMTIVGTPYPGSSTVRRYQE